MTTSLTPALFPNQPTPNPSQEGSKAVDAQQQFPSWEGIGVGSRAEGTSTLRPVLSPGERAGVRTSVHILSNFTGTFEHSPGGFNFVDSPRQNPKP